MAVSGIFHSKLVLKRTSERLRFGFECLAVSADLGISDIARISTEVRTDPVLFTTVVVMLYALPSKIALRRIEGMDELRGQFRLSFWWFALQGLLHIYHFWMRPLQR